MTNEVNQLIAYHGDVTQAMTAERTALESRLIPVSAYILISAVEAWYRWPDMVAAIDRAMAAEDVGAAGRRPGVRVNAVHLWSLANIYLLGRKMLMTFGMADDSLERTQTVLDFWRRAALAYRADGHVQAWDAGFVVQPYGADIVAALVDAAEAVDDERRTRIKRFNAT